MTLDELRSELAWTVARADVRADQLAEALRLLSIASDLIKGLADQQAMSDEWFIPEWDEIKRFLEES